jgi:hypothetical protein
VVVVFKAQVSSAADSRGTIGSRMRIYDARAREAAQHVLTPRTGSWAKSLPKPHIYAGYEKGVGLRPLLHLAFMMPTIADISPGRLYLKLSGGNEDNPTSVPAHLDDGC